VIILKTVKCSIHNVEFTLPTTEEDLLSGKYHNEIMQIHLHNEEYPDCKMVGKVKDKE
jgi:hypothetical protein